MDLIAPASRACPRPAVLCPRCLRDAGAAVELALGRCSRCGLAAGRTKRGAAIVLPEGAPTAPAYESAAVCDRYLAFHYPAEDPLAAILGDRAPPLSSRHPFAASRLWDPAPTGIALDAGCACGAATLALARDHGFAVGLDRSERLIDAAVEVVSSGRARYRLPVEGEIAREVEVEVAAPPNAGFIAGDAHALPFADGAFSTVLALNLADRVADPSRALAELARVAAPGGILIVASPYTWLDEYTPRERWLGGFFRDGRPVFGRDGVRAALGPRFLLEREEDHLFFIRHHARSGQLGLAHIQRFRRAS